MGTSEAWTNLTDGQIADAVHPSWFPNPFGYRLRQWDQNGHSDRIARCIKGLWSGSPAPEDSDLYESTDEETVAKARRLAEEVLRTLTPQPVHT